MQSKIDRFTSGKSLRVLDLFSGCGGLSLGFNKAGFEIIGSVELDKEAARSHALNFHRGHRLFEQYAKSRNIENTSPADLFKDLEITGAIDDQVDIIIGGPPCQAFTRIGRAKLREVKNDLNAFLNDARSQLYKRYLDYVTAFQPLVILMENVPDILNYGGVNIADKVCEDLSKLGYNCRYTLLNTVFYGVPQMRERMFLIGLHESINADITFPDPTHYAELPKGYHGSRNVALKNILNKDEHLHYQTPPVVESDLLLPAVTAQDALSDLPILKSHLVGELKRGIKKTDAEVSYGETKVKNQFQQLMRSWPGFETNGKLNGNVIRYLPRDYPIFKQMKPGDQYPQALNIAEDIFLARIEEQNKSGNFISKGTAEYENILKKIVPPYSAGKFPNKWRKMEADKPSRTLMAHLGKDSYSHIHYDSDQARTISVREAARLQTFPDGFLFKGAMNAALRQIGNAVPPLMATKIAEEIRNTILSNI
jgi:DNA (cytosine-5)-methyltransferase 1